MSTTRVFISHSSRDAALAGSLAAALEAADTPCWISSRDIAPGANYQEAIVGAIAAARALVLLLTEAANASDEVKKELSLASAQGIAVYPVRVGDVQPNPALRYELATRQWIEGDDVPSMARRLAAAIEGSSPRSSAAEAQAVLALPDKPSVAVLPFANIGGDVEQEYFADGMTEEIITALSRIRAFFVIARNSSFTYKGHAVDAKQVGRELGVRYVVEGSVRRGGNRVRIAAQLADALTGTQIWADRFDGAIEDVFELQDRIATSLIGAIEPRIRTAEIERSLRKPPGNLQAYDLVLRALALAASSDPQAHAEAGRLLQQAIEIAPTYALALALRARSIWEPLAAAQLRDSVAARAEIIRLSRLALVHGGDDPEVLALVAPRIGQLVDLHEGIALVEKALALNPNEMTGITLAASLHAYAGQTAKALDYIARAERLNPFAGVDLRNWSTAMAHFVAGQYEQMLPYSATVLRSPSQSIAVSALRYRTASLALLERMAEAQASARDLLAIVPDFTVARARAHLEVDMNNIIKVPGVVDAFCEGLRRAGVPE